MNYHDKLKIKMHSYVKFVYKITGGFPKEELYGVTSQFRRSAMSVMLNYIEGFARSKGKDSKVYKNFLEIAYGSLKESKYLLFFSFDQKYILEKEYNHGNELSEEIGKMLWILIK